MRSCGVDHQKKMESYETRLTKRNRTVTSFLFRISNISEEKYGTDELVCQNGTVGKFWLTEITGPLPEMIPNIRVLRNRPKFQESLHWHNQNICGLHVSMHCSMASKVMESFLSFYYFYQLSMLLNYGFWFCSCKRGKWKRRDSMTFHELTAWITRFVARSRLPVSGDDRTAARDRRATSGVL